MVTRTRIAVEGVLHCFEYFCFSFILPLLFHSFIHSDSVVVGIFYSFKRRVRRIRFLFVTISTVACVFGVLLCGLESSAIIHACHNIYSTEKVFLVMKLIAISK